MSRAEDLLAACDMGDEVRIEQLGWRPVMDALRFWPQRVGGRELAPYALLLGGEDPDAVVEALKGLARDPEYAKWRPGAAAVVAVIERGAVRPGPSDSPRRRVDPGMPTRTGPDTTEHAYEAVIGALLAGVHVCPCLPHSPQWHIDRHGVLRCPHCGGLEPGQVDQARDEFTEDEDAPKPEPEDFIRWAKEVQQERIMEGERRSPLLDALASDGHLEHLGGMLKKMPKVTEADRQREREILGWPEP